MAIYSGSGQVVNLTGWTLVGEEGSSGGAPIGALQYASPLYAAIGFADASGNIAYGLPIPCSSGFSGVQMTGQLVDFDNSLSALLPIGTSAALAMQIGQ